MAGWLRTLYTGLLHLLLPLVLLYLLVRCLRERGYCAGWRQRLGGGPGGIHRLRGEGAKAGPLWVHAASVGEVRAAAGLVRGLLRDHPERPVLVTTTTPTGADQVAELFGREVSHAYLPLDLPWAVAAFLRRWQPELAVILEMEFWPNLYRAIAARRIPLLLANARLSARSAGRYRLLKPLVAATLGRIDRIAAQTGDDAERLRDLGGEALPITVTGSVKFDQAVPEDALNDGAALREELGGSERPVWIAASTREGEEELILAAHERVCTRHPEALLILVPRHPQRFDKVAALCRDSGMAMVRRSAGGAVRATTRVYLGDTMGELPIYYAAADVAFVGGSLVPTGGQNVLEPAALGRPVVLGPHDFNFSHIVRTLVAAGAAEQVADVRELATVIDQLLDAPGRRERMARNGFDLITRNRGATEQLLRQIDALLNGTEGS